MMRFSDCRLEGRGKFGDILGGIVPRGGGGLRWEVVDCNFVLRMRRVQEIRKGTRKEIRREIRRETRKEIRREIRRETRKEIRREIRREIRKRTCW